MAKLIHLVSTMDAGGNPRLFWKHMIGLVLLEMRDRGWSGGRIVDATWKDGQLGIQVEPGQGLPDVPALAEFIEGKRKRAKK